MPKKGLGGHPYLFLVIAFILLTGCVSNGSEFQGKPDTEPDIVYSTYGPDSQSNTHISAPISPTYQAPVQPGPTPVSYPLFTVSTPEASTYPIATVSATGKTNSVSEAEEGIVTNVIDGDTIKVNLNGIIQTIRYIGIDSPESKHPSQPVECYAVEADAFNTELVLGKTVRLEKDISETDRYDRLLRYVWLDNELVNELLVRRGFAIAYPYPPDTKYQSAFSYAEQQAKQQGAGLWAACNSASATQTPSPSISRTQSPSQSPTSTTTPSLTPTTSPNPTPATTCDPSYPDVCIAPYPPDLDCGEIPYKNFHVLEPDPHGFDRDNDGVGCES